MPPRRQTSGRHRRPKNSGAAYVTAATLAAFTVGGVNVPGAIGASRESDHTTLTAAKDTDNREALRVAKARQAALDAQRLRDRLAAEDAMRVSRMRELRAEAREKAQQRRQARAAALRKAAAAREAARPKYVAPVLNFRWSAGYGESSSLWSSMHTGQDFAAPEGTSVRSVADGTVVSAAWEGSYGQKVVVLHDDGTETWYAHLSSFVRTGGRVQAGDVIGRVGSTGNSTGSHLHLEVRPGGGDPVEPISWLRSHGVNL